MTSKRENLSVTSVGREYDGMNQLYAKFEIVTKCLAFS
jgi:hypothetical protein